MVKAIGIFISGAVTGATVTYILMKNKQNVRDKEIQQEINLIKKDYSWKKEFDSEDDEDEDDPVEDDDEEDHRQVYNYAARSEKLRKANRARDEEKKIFRSVRNQDYLDDLINEEEEDEEDDDDVYSDGTPYPDGRVVGGSDGAPAPSEGPSDHPYSISADLFANTCNHFDKCTLIWYSVDDILADDTNERLVDIGVVGQDWREHIGEYEPDVAYIRNESIAVDYEIVKEDLSYFKDAL